MKKLILTFCLFLLAFSTYGADLQETETLYREGKFASALTQYEELLKTYPNDPHLYYNIGNSYFKMGSKGLAIANYYRAFKLAPRDKDIRHNLILALNSSGEKFVPSGMPEALHKVFFSLTAEELKGVLFLSLWLFCSLGMIWLIKRRFAALALTSLIILVILGSWYQWRARLDGQKLAVVAAPMAELRSGPGMNFPASANISQGHLLILEDAKDNWYEVIVKSQGLKGWTEASTLEKI